MTSRALSPAGASRPRVASFPKGFFHELIARNSMTIEDWIRRAPSLGIEGVELYPAFLDGTDSAALARLRNVATDVGIALPMMCSSPDFIDPAPGAWGEAVRYMHEMIDIMDELSAPSSWRSARVLSGQAWPEVPEDEGIARAVEGIEAVLGHAASKNVYLVMENHYKDGLWSYPEFAQKQAVFLAIIDKIDSPYFGVNFDPSNAIVAGEDPLTLLDRVAGRVVSMHASDRSLRSGYTIDDLKSHRGAGYPDALCHGIVGQGLNDYPAIFTRLAAEGFTGWISIEDGERGGEDGFADIAASADYLHALIEVHWPTTQGEPS